MVYQSHSTRGMEISVMRDIDLDRLLQDTRIELAKVMDTVIQQLQSARNCLDSPNNDFDSLQNVNITYQMLLNLDARLGALNTIKKTMAPRPPIEIREIQYALEDAMLLAERDEPLEYFGAATIIVGLKNAKLLQMRKMARNRCRYTFVKRPTEFPREYKAFLKLATYFGLTLEHHGVTLVGDWDTVGGHVRALKI